MHDWKFLPYGAAARKSFLSEFTGSMYRFGIGFIIFASAAFDDKNHVFCFQFSTQHTEHRSNKTFAAKDAGFLDHMQCHAHEENCFQSAQL